jgi:hypothetical protein
LNQVATPGWYKHDECGQQQLWFLHQEGRTSEFA